MAIASVGTLGTGASSTSNNTLAFTTATNSLSSGDFAILTIVSDNNATGADGDGSEVTGVSGGTGTWSKLAEFGNNNGAAAAGVLTALWLFEATGTVNTGTTITVTFGSNRTDKCCSFWKFTRASGTTIIAEPGTTTQTSATDASNDYGSVSFSGLVSKSRLYFRGAGKEANSTTDITQSANFTRITVARSRNNASAVFVRGEFRINTSTGETSAPTLAVSGDTACVFVALTEQMAGTASPTLGDVTSSAAGAVDVAGASSATLGAVTSSAAGTVDVAGSAALTLAALTLTAAGTVADAGVSGESASTLAAVTTTAAGTVEVRGASSSTLAAATTTAAGTVNVAGTSSSTLAAATQTAAGGVAVQGASSSSLDAATQAAAGGVAVVAQSASTLSSAMTAGAGAVSVSGASSSSLAAVFGTADGVVGNPPVEGVSASTLAAVSLTAAGTVAVSGAGLVTLAAVSMSAAGVAEDVTPTGTVTTVAPVVDRTAYAASPPRRARTTVARGTAEDRTAYATPLQGAGV